MVGDHSREGASRAEAGKLPGAGVNAVCLERGGKGARRAADRGPRDLLGVRAGRHGGQTRFLSTPGLLQDQGGTSRERKRNHRKEPVAGDRGKGSRDEDLQAVQAEGGDKGVSRLTDRRRWTEGRMSARVMHRESKPGWMQKGPGRGQEEGQRPSQGSKCSQLWADKRGPAARLLSGSEVVGTGP